MVALAKRRKRVRKEKFDQRFVIILAILAIVSILYLGSKGTETTQGKILPPTTVPIIVTQTATCGNLGIGIDFEKEAASFYTRGYLRPAPEGLKLLFYEMTATNKGQESREFAGYRINLLDQNGNRYNIQPMGNIEKITLTNGVTEDFACDELAIASASRVTLYPGESATGCKMFQIPYSAMPASIQVYELENLKCSIPI